MSASAHPALTLLNGAVTLNPPNHLIGPTYSAVAHAASTNTIIVTTAGQVGIYPDGKIPTDVDEEIELAINKLQNALAAAGARQHDILKLTYYMVDYDYTNPRQRPPLLKFLGACRPPATLIPVTKLAQPGYHFEIEATAAVPQHPLERVDVLVIGAGLSGLQAAVDLQRAGLKVKVLEARDRVGGKTWSRPVDGAMCDVGAAWINDTNQERMYALAKRFNLDLIVQCTEGAYVCDKGLGNHKTHPYGQLNSDDSDREEIEEMVRIRDLFEATCQQIDIHDSVASAKNVQPDLDEITLEQWLRQQNCKQSGVNVITLGVRAMLGVEPSEVSALYFLNYCKSGGGYMQMRSDRKDGGQYLRVTQGTQSFALGLVDELEPDSVRLMSPVRKIEQLDSGLVRVTSVRGTYEAKKAVVSLPTPLYKDVQFTPPLPADKLELSEFALLGDYCKAIVMYEKPWWRAHGLCGLSQATSGPFTVTRDSSNDAQGHYSLTCFVVGQPARDWKVLAKAARKEAVLAQLQRIYGPFASIEAPSDYLEQIWKFDQWTQGCPCPVLGPGGLARFEKTLRAPFGNIHFVGTETAYEWKGYMEGAVRSGERGAQEILAGSLKDTHA